VSRALTAVVGCLDGNGEYALSPFPRRSILNSPKRKVLPPFIIVVNSRVLA